VAKQIEHHWDRPTGRVDDPWAWLRDRNDPDTIAYLEAENAYSRAWFAEHEHLVESIFGEIKSRIQETDITAPIKDREWWYTARTEEGRNYPIHCRGRSAADAASQVLLDENLEAEGGSSPRSHAPDVSPNQRLLAWSADATTASARCASAISTPAWTLLDASTTRSGAARRGRRKRAAHLSPPTKERRPYRVWRHDLGPQADDTLVFEESDERFYVYVQLTRSENWIIIDSRCKTFSEVLLIPADDPKSEPMIARARTEDVDYAVDHWGDQFLILTNLDAEDFRVMTAPHDAPSVWTELVGHQHGRRIVSIEPFERHLVLHEWSDAQQRLRVLLSEGGERVFDLGSEPHEVEIDANPEWDSTTFRYRYQSLTTPMTIYEEDVRTGERTLLKQTPVPGVDLSRYTATRVGDVPRRHTQVPVDLVRCVDTPADGTPCLIYAYGSYEASEAPVQSGHGSRCSIVGSCGRWPIRVAAGSSAGAGTSTASSSTSATPSSTPSPSPSMSSPTTGPRRRESRSAAAAPVACWSARA
jgi:oligopeptidase B